MQVSEAQWTAWAIAVSLQPVFDEMFDEHVCDPGEFAVPEYLHFELLLQARAPPFVRERLSYVVPNIHRRAHWLRQQCGLKTEFTHLDVLAHLWSIKFYDWMSRRFWSYCNEVESIMQCCAPWHCAQWSPAYKL